jgi:hypothetical protein
MASLTLSGWRTCTCAFMGMFDTSTASPKSLGNLDLSTTMFGRLTPDPCEPRDSAR